MKDEWLTHTGKMERALAAWWRLREKEEIAKTQKIKWTKLNSYNWRMPILNPSSITGINTTSY